MVPTIDTLTGHVVGHGTLSEYRNEEDGISVRADTDRAAMRFEDDYVWIELEADTPGAAANAGLAVLDADELSGARDVFSKPL